MVEGRWRGLSVPSGHVPSSDLREALRELPALDPCGDGDSKSNGSGERPARACAEFMGVGN